MLERKPHQLRAVAEFQRLRHLKRLAITSPTGGGKSLMIEDIIGLARSATLFTNRKVLTDQMIAAFERANIYFGVRAADYKDQFRPNAPVQISSKDTEWSRVYKTKRWTLSKSEIVIVDEGHAQQGKAIETILNDHEAAGATVVEFSATPVNLSHRCKELIVAGTNSELRSVGMHVICKTFEPGTLDFRKAAKTGEFNDGDVVKNVWTPVIFGKVLEHYNRLNPERLPTICRCPSVPTAVWMSEQFEAAGIPSASLDGEEIIIKGNRIPSSRDARKELMERFDDGSVKVITFRDVLREAWDFPKLYHLILASPIGTLQTYLQVVGRLLRSHPSLDHVVLQDHGANFLRHGSPNADRDWRSLWKSDPKSITEDRIERMREKELEEPIVCPKCYASRNGGLFCHHCGYRTPKKTREIIQKDGTLREVEGDIFKPRIIKVHPDNQRRWDSQFFRCRNAGMTFKQAYALFYLDHHYYPPRTLANMPRDREGWKQKCNAKGLDLIPRGQAV